MSEYLEIPPTAYPMRLWELNSSRYNLKHSVNVVIEEYPDNEFIAHWHDVEAIGFGESKEETIDSLKQDIVDLYEDLTTVDDNELGKLPFRAKKILKQSICQLAEITNE